jgi:hypothetical protein
VREETVMKDKDIIKGEELERINNELFDPFESDDESWMVGGSGTLTTVYSFGPNGVNDHMVDYDWAEVEIVQAS